MSLVTLLYNLWSEESYISRLKPQYSLESKKQSYKDVKDETGFGKNYVYTNESFSELVKSKASTIEVFSTTKGADNLSIHANISKNTPEALTIKNAIENALTPSNEFTKAQNTFLKHIAEFNKQIQLTPKKYKTQDLIESIVESQADARASIVKQHTDEIQKLQTNLRSTSPDNYGNLKTALGTDNVGTDKAIENMIIDLKAAQKKQLDDFDAANAKAIKNLHYKAASEIGVIAYIARLAKNNAEMAEIIEALAMKNLQANSNTGIKYNDSGVSISGVSMDDINIIKTLTGNTIKRENDGSYSVDFSSRIAWPGYYYLSYKQNPKTDMRELASAIRACGHPKISMDVNFSDPEIAQERAQQAYEACIEAGFSPENIIINVNGVAKKPDEIFKDNPSRLQTYNAKAETIKQETKALWDELKENKPPLNKENVNKYKKERDEAITQQEELDNQNIKP